MVGELLEGRYRIVREIASGGMSTVYEATHVKIGRTVAIKVLHPDLAGDKDVVARFLNEARAVGTFGHPNIVASTDFGELPGHVPYLVLEYLEGRTLSTEIASDGPLPVRRVGRIAMQIASALDAAHTRGVVHRDLTSANIFLTKTEGNPDHVKVLDFGISKFLTTHESTPKTRRGLTMGTPEFMAPEQISEPTDVDGRVDVYALGCIMYDMLAGHPPFHDLPLQSLLTQILVEPAPAIERGGIPDGLRAIVVRALAKEPGDRFATMREMGAALARVNSLVFPITDAPDFIETPGPEDVRSAPIPVRSAGSGASQRSGAIPRTPVDPARDATVAVRRRISPSVLAALLALLALNGVLVVMRMRRTEAPPAPRIESPPPIAAAVSPPAPPEAPPSSLPEPATVDVRIESPAPDAKVTMRGHTARLPLRESIKPGTQPEVVEVTAPKREGKRFWITLDQPIALSTRLSRGHGIVDATKKETALALGRPAEDATAEPAEHPGHRHAAHVAVHAASAAPVAAATKPAAPPPEHPAPAEPPAEPKAAAPTPPKPEPVTPKAEAVAAAPKPAAAPSTPTGLDPAKTQATVRSHLPEIQRCYERGKMDYPELKGRVTMRIAVSATGSVTSAAVESSSLANGAVESCMTSAISRWKFPAPLGGPAIISYPFNLR